MNLKIQKNKNPKKKNSVKKKEFFLILCSSTTHIEDTEQNKENNG